MKLNVNEGMVNITLIHNIIVSTITYTQMFEEYIILRRFMYLFSM